MRNLFKSNGSLTKFVMRRERIQSPVWLLCLIGLTVAVPLAFAEMYATVADRMGMVITMENPAMIAMLGPVYGADDYTTGAMTSNMMLTFTIIGVALMNIFLVIRHTRRDEERGRIEVLRSLPVGRLSSLGAVMTFAVILNIVLALLTGLGLTVLGIDSMDLAGSMLYGVCLGVSGLFFASAAAIFSQLCVSSRGAMGYSLAFLFLCYLLRAVGDINSEVLACISPLGLILRAQVYVENSWWPVLIVLLESVVFGMIAFYLNSLRDLDQGFIPAKPGRKTASRFLKSPFGLAWRLLRTTLISWLIGMLLLGASYGSIMGNLESFLANNEMIQKMLPPVTGYSSTELFITMLMSIMAMAAAIPALSAFLKLRSEEKRNHNEHLLARAVSRPRLMTGYLVLAMACSFIMLFAEMLGLWGASSAVMETPIAFGSMFKAMAVYLPALWLSLGIAVLLFGLLPNRTSIAWLYLGYSFFAVYLGRVIGLPDWLRKISPFGLIPQLPLEEINYLTLTLITAAAAACIAAGYAFYRRRDSLG